MKKLIVFVFLGSLLGLTSCGNNNPFGNSNPYAKSPKDIQNGEPKKGPQAPDEKPIGKDVFVIDGEGFAEHVILEQNTPREVVLTARSFFDKSKYKLEITNLKSFKGATVEMIDGDATTGQVATVKFRWTPTAADVIAAVTVYHLDLHVYTTNMNNSYSDNKTLSLFVYRADYTAPSIVSIKPPVDPIKEDTKSTFEVIVKDVDALDFQDARPMLMMLPDFNGDVNIAPYLNASDATKDPNDSTLWHFTVTVDLSGAEVTDDESNGNFYIAARSRFDKVSVPSIGVVTLWTAVAQPTTSWIGDIQFQAGAMNFHQFTVQDPKGEGSVSAQFTTLCSTLPGGASCSCSQQLVASVADESAVICSIKWNVPATTTIGSKFPVNYTATSMSPNKSDVVPVSNSFIGNIEIVN